ncbi:MAG TPA: sulfite exporter TauE/SafE family protein [Candidatus Ruania gallistercoris]|uniref:Probable membrane transporter protein n=1 Tax=Candidatus Ruania gallistercoris TaxID=2838746 RepID=A0A9D2J612_9MICO|nr:sulfite exporter TauE/SafE family protein [Candidatus Ruania gallistercoris]
MTLAVFVLLGVTVFVAAFAQGSAGMGFAMIAAPVVSLVDPALIPVLLLVLMIPLNSYVGWRERADLDWRGITWISVGRFAGTFLGLWILLVVSMQQLSLLIGISTIVAAVVALLAPAFDPNRTGLTVVGLITGVTETSTGVGGPPLALAYQHKSGPMLRSTVAVCFLVGEVISLVVLGISGQIQGATLLVSAALLPFVGLGSFVSRFTHHRLDGPLLRYLVLVFAIVSGIIVIAQA